jgi:Fur family transcriptional regulator, ferric uptake regulator
MSENDLEKVRKHLEEKGYRLTPQRAIILETLLNQPNRHLSADDLYTMVKEKHPELGIATVYRTLELFRELGVVNQMDFAEGLSRYEYSNWEHHHHLVCLKCGEIQEFSSDKLEAIENELAKEHHFEVVGHHMKLYGYCQECRPK